MTKLLTLFSLFISFACCAQYSSQQIKKLKISRIIMLSVTQGHEEINKCEIWFDQKGNDTAEYRDGKLFQRTRYEYHPSGHPATRIKYRGDGTEISTAIYTYNADSSYTISDTDKDFGMTEYTYCTRGGNVTKVVSPDKTELVSFFDTKGRLIRIKSNAVDNGAILTDIQYSYNAHNQLIKEISKGDYKWTKSYTYNTKGLVVKGKLISITDEMPDPEVTTSYEYEFLK